MRMLRIANVTEEGRFGELQRWIPAVSGRLKGFGSDQCNLSYRDSDRPYKELNQRGIETQGIVLHWLSRERGLEVGSQ